jgi:hypothetical protein
MATANPTTAAEARRLHQLADAISDGTRHVQAILSAAYLTDDPRLRMDLVSAAQSHVETFLGDTGEHLRAIANTVATANGGEL